MCCLLVACVFVVNATGIVDIDGLLCIVVICPIVLMCFASRFSRVDVYCMPTV